MEMIRDIITAYLPTLSSIAAIIISVLTFLGKVKTIVGSNIKENQDLKHLMTEITAANDQYKASIAAGNDKVIETIALLKDELKTAQKQLKVAKEELAVQAEQLEEIKEIKEAYEKTYDEVNLVKRKLKAIEEE